MILVNTPGSYSYVYAPLKHASWHGFTPTDLIFPFFLFAVGNALSFALKKYESKGHATIVKKILKRSLLILFIGLMLNWFPFVAWHEDVLKPKLLENLRLYGVLPRIALAYCGGALILHFFKANVALFISILILIAYGFILYIFGDFTLEGNAIRKLDIWLVGESHMYKGYFSKVLDSNIAFDPEGFLSTLPAIASVIFGFLVGRYIQRQQEPYGMVTRLVLGGILITCLGLVVDIFFPINKPLWSSSYVLFSTGTAIIMLSLIIFLVDLKGLKSWSKPFIHFGKNPLFIFVMSGVLVRIYLLVRIGDISFYSWLFVHVFQALAGSELGSFLFALAHVILFWAVAKWLDWQKIYIKV